MPVGLSVQQCQREQPDLLRVMAMFKLKNTYESVMAVFKFKNVRENGRSIKWLSV